MWMRQLLNSSKFEHEPPLSQPQIRTEELNFVSTRQQNSNGTCEQEQDTLLDELSPKQCSTYAGSQILSPTCNTIKLMPKNEPKHMLEEIAYRSQSRKNRSRTQNTAMNALSRQGGDSVQNKDMEEMLQDQDLRESQEKTGRVQTLQARPEQLAEQLVGAPVKKGTFNKKGSLFSAQNLSKNQLETSEENHSNNALHPVGMLDSDRDISGKKRRQSSTVMLRHRVHESDNEEEEKLASLEQSDEKGKKQVFSHYDEHLVNRAKSNLPQ